MQAEADQLFLQLESHAIDRRQYVHQINELYDRIPLPQRGNVARRKDTRSLGIFALSIYDNTKREKFLINAWCDQIPNQAYQIIDNGINNDGRLIIDTSNCKSVSDYVLKNNFETRHVEVKFSPCQWKMTFKKADFNAYLKEDASILLIMGNVGMMGPNGVPEGNTELVLPKGLKWTLITPHQISKIMEEVPVRNCWEVGGKPSYQLFAKDFHKFIEVHDWVRRPCELASEPV